MGYIVHTAARKKQCAGEKDLTVCLCAKHVSNWHLWISFKMNYLWYWMASRRIDMWHRLKTTAINHIWQEKRCHPPNSTTWSPTQFDWHLMLLLSINYSLFLSTVLISISLVELLAGHLIVEPIIMVHGCHKQLDGKQRFLWLETDKILKLPNIHSAILRHTRKDDRILSNFLGRGRVTVSLKKWCWRISYKVCISKGTDAIECFLLQRR